MPAAALQSLAKKAGKSLADAEKYWKEVKQQLMDDTGKSAKDLTDKDYQFIMGVVKKRLGLSESLAEAFIEMILGGSEVASVVEMVFIESKKIRTFFDSGMVCFATLEDIVIPTGTDERVDFITQLVNENDWPHSHPLLDYLDGYEGSISELYDEVAKMVNLGSQHAS